MRRRENCAKSFGEGIAATGGSRQFIAHQRVERSQRGQGLRSGGSVKSVVGGAAGAAVCGRGCIVSVGAVVVENEQLE